MFRSHWGSMYAGVFGKREMLKALTTISLLIHKLYLLHQCSSLISTAATKVKSKPLPTPLILSTPIFTEDVDPLLLCSYDYVWNFKIETSFIVLIEMVLFSLFSV